MIKQTLLWIPAFAGMTKNSFMGSLSVIPAQAGIQICRVRTAHHLRPDIRCGAQCTPYIAGIVAQCAPYICSLCILILCLCLSACAGSKHSGYHVSMLFTSLTPTAEKQLGAMARSEFGAG